MLGVVHEVEQTPGHAAPRVVHRLAPIVRDGEADVDEHRQVAQAPAGLARRDLDPIEGAPQVLGRADAGHDDAVGRLTGVGGQSRPVGRHVDRDVGLPLAELRAADVHRLPHLGDARGLAAERAHRVVAGAEAQDAAPARQLVDGQHGPGRHARVTGHGVGHTRTNADAARVHGEQGRRGPGIGEDVLPVDDPHVLAPRGLGKLGHLDVPRMRDVLHQEQIALDHAATYSTVRARLDTVGGAG